MLDLGFPASAVKAVPILARTASLLAHLAEEQEDTHRPRAREEGGRGGRGVTSADAESYRAQIAYLLERSPFYREKLGPSPSDRLEDIAELPLTEKSELREERHARRIRSARTSAPIRPRSSGSTRRAAPPAPRATSRSPRATSRTGSPARPESYAASGVEAGPAHRLDVQRGTVRGRRGARRLRADRARPHPGRDRQHRRFSSARSRRSSPRPSC